MKICIYCGFDNADNRKRCSGCSSVLELEPSSGQDEWLPAIEPQNISAVELHSQLEHGFEYPDWDGVWRQIERDYAREDWFDAWHAVSRRWLLTLKECLGGTYRVCESENFLLLSTEGPEPCRTMLSYAEASLKAINRLIGPVQSGESYGKFVILAFSEVDDYYAYISHYYPEGEHGLSAGVFLSRGYMHVAFPFHFVFSTKRIITHELVHNSIAHLNIPTWLHEGLAMRIESFVLDQPFVLEREDAEKHQGYWNEETIQEFWSGVSFYGPDEANLLSYNLSQVLVVLLSKDWNQFIEFVQRADYRDGGQDAAVTVYGSGLENALSGMLGDGDWRPNRKVIARLLADRGKASGGDASQPGS